VGGDPRAWFLRIVRNTCYGWRNGHHGTDPFDEERHGTRLDQSDPETLLLQSDGSTPVERALGRLPDHLRRLLVLRELEGLSYRELAQAAGIPAGTVMSRLSRGRQALRRAFDCELASRDADCAPSGIISAGVRFRMSKRLHPASAVACTSCCEE
jgi:RNA polymerase sigma factor (sigma-70 family)